MPFSTPVDNRLLVSTYTGTRVVLSTAGQFNLVQVPDDATHVSLYVPSGGDVRFFLDPTEAEPGKNLSGTYLLENGSPLTAELWHTFPLSNRVNGKSPRMFGLVGGTGTPELCWVQPELEERCRCG